ncbi:MAG: UPF0158 family protein [Chloroflexota bacterium]
MSNRPIPDPVEATFRDLCGAVYTGDGRAAMAAIERVPDLGTLQYVGDGLLLALAQGVMGAALRAGEHIAAIRSRGLDGDEDLAIELEAALGLAQAPALRGLPVDLDDLSLALEGDPLLTGGRLDLRTGEVQQIGPLYESDFFDELGEPDDGEADWADGLEDGQVDDRWLRFDSLGSRPGFRDMTEFLETVADERLATRLDRALGGRGAFRRFKDELADVPDELARFHRFTDDRRRGRARQWLAESGLRPTEPAEPDSPGRPDLLRLP